MARSRFGKWALAFVAALACLSLAELLLRWLAPVYLVGIQDAYEYDAEMGYRLRPGIRRSKLTDHLEEIRTNRLGSVNFQEGFDEYPVLVFALGDSFTQGTGSPPHESYPFQLDLILNRDETGLYAKRFGIVNLGLAAFGGRQSLLALRRYAGLVGKPCLVLYLGAENDYEDDLLFASGYTHHHVVRGSPRWGAAVGPLLWLGDFEVVKRAKIAVSAARRARIFRAASGPVSSRKSIAELEWPVIDGIAEQCRGYGARLIVGWADPDSPSYPWLKAKAQARGLPFADFAPAMAAVLANIPELEARNPHSGGHWRGWVSRLIAEAYARRILEATPPSCPSPAGRGAGRASHGGSGLWIERPASPPAKPVAQPVSPSSSR